MSVDRDILKAREDRRAGRGKEFAFVEDMIAYLHAPLRRGGCAAPFFVAYYRHGFPSLRTRTSKIRQGHRR